MDSIKSISGLDIRENLSDQFGRTEYETGGLREKKNSVNMVTCKKVYYYWDLELTEIGEMHLLVVLLHH